MSHGHSKWAPSSAHRRIACPASLREEEGRPDRESIESVEGNVAHDVADRCFPNFWDASFLENEVQLKSVNGVMHEIVVDAEMVENVQSYLDYCRQLPGDHFSEQRLDISRWTPDRDQFGTSDHIACNDGHLTITDLKYGKGVQVFAYPNPQLVEYALGAYDAYDWLYGFTHVTVRIAQPRLDHFDEHTYTVQELLNFGAFIKAKYYEALRPDAPYGPDDKACMFCKARATCSALRAKYESAAALAFSDLDDRFVKTPRELTAEEITEAFFAEKLYAIQFNAIAEERYRRMLNGMTVPGLKLVEGVTHRRFRSDTEAVEAMTACCIPTSKQFTRKMISPRAARALVPKESRAVLDSVIVKPPGKPTVVAETDKRPVYGSRHAGAFDDLDEAEHAEQDDFEL